MTRRTDAAIGLTLLLVCGACSDGAVIPDPDENVVDLDAVFAPPSVSEIAAISSEWAARDVSAAGIVVELDTVVALDTTRLSVQVVSHLVGGSRHYGAILRDSALVGPAPVIVYAHGGAEGVSVEGVLFQLPFVGDAARDFIWVVPSFRSEALDFGSATWTSEGQASPWDRDVDDALALLAVTLEMEAAADSTRVGVIGFSRGGGVALLMAARDPRIDRVVEFFGPTDFFDDFIRSLVDQALAGTVRDLPGLDALDDQFIQPLGEGTLTVAQMRRELVRRSVVLFADRLPAVQLHHGKDDLIVEVSQAQSLIDAMNALGRGPPDFVAYLYDGGLHNPFTLTGSFGRTVDFLLALEDSPFAVSR